ncbi:MULTISPECIES: type II toxin-antitoxin system RelE family toxin [unclassified Sphaerochaeta]|uniref:type II toxin-antitoxin system RelE family toxin n=1 Tax=unclassified Sphaerochaeta TaxID=2637943 RepID=UPI0039C90751
MYQHGKSLAADRSGQGRYRIGDYRLIAEILHDRVVILILHVGHRKDVYTQSMMLSADVAVV